MEYFTRNQIYEKIRQDILDGKYIRGQSLVEMKLAKEFGVSRTPIREVLRQLELDGLVESIPNRGVFVLGITNEDIKQIYAIRQRIEGLAALWAADRMTSEDLKELENIYNLMEFYTQRQDVDQVAKLNTQFHEIIFKSANCKYLKNILSNFQVYLQWARYASLKVHGRLQAALAEHKDILEALKQKDGVLAEKRIMEHVDNSRKNLEKDSR
ncbi:GntR family transcriptional regulator [Lutispora thermophila]|uniref:DNA-binding transcriptional regulator, GntR family n=1 Tax=Lutispora thermophila DSM 19022 TaxID=1122184 RepID=A0A1M6AU31_9FIRM|nr:GntR family transcriptional regulator [Lutispora thermophila]SHI39921.1 DNA-binding transcriptional regulator, GntR family [Lutispora thermophila DSM 19022]